MHCPKLNREKHLRLCKASVVWPETFAACDAVLCNEKRSQYQAVMYNAAYEVTLLYNIATLLRWFHTYVTALLLVPTPHCLVPTRSGPAPLPAMVTGVTGPFRDGGEMLAWLGALRKSFSLWFTDTITIVFGEIGDEQRAVMSNKQRPSWHEKQCSVWWQTGSPGPFQNQWLCDYSGYLQLAEAGTERRCGQGAGLKSSKSGWNEKWQERGVIQTPLQQQQQQQQPLVLQQTGNHLESWISICGS